MEHCSFCVCVCVRVSVRSCANDMYFPLCDFPVFSTGKKKLKSGTLSCSQSGNTGVFQPSVVSCTMRQRIISGWGWGVAGDVADERSGLVCQADE